MNHINNKIPMKKDIELMILCCCLMILSCAASKQQAQQTDLPQSGEFVPVGKPPEQIKAVTPEYPEEAAKLGITGTVWVKAMVDSLGNVADVVVVEDKGENVNDFKYSAIRAAFRTLWKPALSKDGKPITVWVTYKIEYKFR